MSLGRYFRNPPQGRQVVKPPRKIPCQHRASGQRCGCWRQRFGRFLALSGPGARTRSLPERLVVGLPLTALAFRVRSRVAGSVRQRATCRDATRFQASGAMRSRDEAGKVLGGERVAGWRSSSPAVPRRSLHPVRATSEGTGSAADAPKASGFAKVKIRPGWSRRVPRSDAARRP